MRQLEDAEIVAFIGEAKFAAEPFQFDVRDHEVSLRRCPVGDDRALYVGDDCLNVRLVETENRRPVKWHAVHKFDERVLDFAE